MLDKLKVKLRYVGRDPFATPKDLYLPYILFADKLQATSEGMSWRFGVYGHGQGFFWQWGPRAESFHEVSIG
jgi:hypothetical protein